jgi:hypothetical protein
MKRIDRINRMNRMNKMNRIKELGLQRCGRSEGFDRRIGPDASSMFGFL